MDLASIGAVRNDGRIRLQDPGAHISRGVSFSGGLSREIVRISSAALELFGSAAESTILPHPSPVFSDQGVRVQISSDAMNRFAASGITL